MVSWNTGLVSVGSTAATSRTREVRRLPAMPLGTKPVWLTTARTLASVSGETRSG